MKEQITISARSEGWPFWIDVIPKTQGAICLRLVEAKQLKLQLDEAIRYVERQEELDHFRTLRQLKD